MQEGTKKLNKYERYKARVTPYEYFPKIESLDFDNLGEGDRYYLQDFGIFSADFMEDEFTLRLRTPAGRVTTKQFSVIADIMTKYHLDLVLTARAGMQLHNLDSTNILRVFQQINALGITTWQSVGDNIRNIVTDIYDGVGIYNKIEVFPILQEMEKSIIKNPRYVGMLPRRISVGISGNSSNVSSLFANDLYFALALKNDILGFNVYMGGKNSEVAQDANIFLKPDEVVEFFKTFIEAFYKHGSRGSRAKTRLFHLLEKIGMDAFKGFIKDEYKKEFTSAGKLQLKKSNFSAIEKLKDETYSFCYKTNFSRMNAKEIKDIAVFASEKNAQIRLGIDQNIYILGLKDKEVPFKNLKESATVIACAGSEYCPFSFWNIKNETSYLPLDKISEHQIEVGFSGCAKGCGRHRHTDIGLIGLKTNNFGDTEGGARVFIGAGHSEGSSVGRMIFSMVPLVHLDALFRLVITLFENSSYNDFEEYATKILNRYSEEFLAMWYLANLQTKQTLGLVPDDAKMDTDVSKNFSYEKELLRKHFANEDFMELIEDSFYKAVNTTSKKLWTIQGKDHNYKPPIKRTVFR